MQVPGSAGTRKNKEQGKGDCGNQISSDGSKAYSCYQFFLLAGKLLR
jgi:hypothetical protein